MSNLTCSSTGCLLIYCVQKKNCFHSFNLLWSISGGYDYNYSRILDQLIAFDDVYPDVLKNSVSLLDSFRDIII